VSGIMIKVCSLIIGLVLVLILVAAVQVPESIVILMGRTEG
jgi:hypothetical protein